MRNKSILCMSACLFILPVWAQRSRQTLNDAWEFQKPGTNWQAVTLPHSWNEDAYRVKDYYQGEGNYRRSLNVPQQWQGKQLFLTLEAANKKAFVKIDGQQVGQHQGGYTAYTVDVTDALRSGGNHTLEVTVDNSCQDVAPLSADFTFMGGIYRDVWMTATAPQHFVLTNHASSGIFISTPQVSDQSAQLEVRSQLKNESDSKVQLELRHTIYAPDGTVQQVISRKVDMLPGQEQEVTLQAKEIMDPQLWSPENPVLYRVESQLLERKSQQVLDADSHYTAFRYFSFNGETGFSLNGKPYKLRGICRHQDQRPYGYGLTNDQHRRDFRMMKQMGANFIRISHYPQDEALLELCDKEGMLAWEEIPIINSVPDTPGFAENCEENLRDMIRQHYNHPSVIMWGYMNEILLMTTRMPKAAQPPILERTKVLAKRLQEVLVEEDRWRASTMAFHGSEDYNTEGLSELTDVVGWNLYNGWYSGGLEGFEQFVADQHKRFPNHPMIISEYGAGSDKRLHSTSPKSFDFSSEYQQTYAEHYLPVLENTPYLCGGSYWNFIDFSSAVRDEATPRINNKGLTYPDRTPKDVYYYFQALWRKDIPVIHIASRDWNSRAGVQGAPGAPVMMPVKVYTNQPEVKLWLNGQPVGTQRAANCFAVFQVPFTEGRCLLYAEAAGDNTVNDAVEVKFAATPLTLTAENMKGREIAVNVGSNCSYTSEASGLTWLPDQAYQPGSWGYVGGKEAVTQTEILRTVEGPLYQSSRTALEGYRFDVPAGQYEVELHFAAQKKSAYELYLLGKTDGENAVEDSKFDVQINGQVVDPDVCPAAQVGYFHAMPRTYIISVSEGEGLNITLPSSVGTNMLSAVKVRQL